MNEAANHPAISMVRGALVETNIHECFFQDDYGDLDEDNRYNHQCEDPECVIRQFRDRVRNGTSVEQLQGLIAGFASPNATTSEFLRKFFFYNAPSAQLV